MNNTPTVVKARVRNVSRWQDIVRENFLPLEFTIPSGHDFFSTVAVRPLGEVQLACVSAGAQRVVRTPRLAGQSERSYYKIFWQLCGRSRVTQAGRIGNLSGGDWTYYDTTLPYEIDTDAGSRFAVALLPQEHCVGWCSTATGIAMTACGQARAAAALVMSVLGDDNVYDRRAAANVVSSICDLMQAALAGQIMDDVLQAPTGRFELAHNYIRSHLEDPELTPETLASALNVSRRTLYACFAKYGHSPFALIQQLRLEECRRVLADATVLDRTITRIAFDQGFNDISHFSRVFKQTYGSSPRNYRKQVIG